MPHEHTLDNKKGNLYSTVINCKINYKRAVDKELKQVLVKTQAIQTLKNNNNKNWKKILCLITME